MGSPTALYEASTRGLKKMPLSCKANYRHDAEGALREKAREFGSGLFRLSLRLFFALLFSAALITHSCLFFSFFFKSIIYNKCQYSRRYRLSSSIRDTRTREHHFNAFKSIYKHGLTALGLYTNKQKKCTFEGVNEDKGRKGM